MENVRNTLASRLPIEPRWSFVVCGLWLHLGFVGASAFVIELLRQFDGGANPLLGPAGAVGAGALTAFAWHGSGAVLDRIDASGITATVPRRPGTFGQDLESVVPR